MCLAIPSKIIQIEDTLATVDISGLTTQISLLLMPEMVNIGDYVLIHAGFAIQKISQDAANDTLKFLFEKISLDGT
jgi:hydrogenase expression/formation protein HypC